MTTEQSVIFKIFSSELFDNQKEITTFAVRFGLNQYIS